MTRRTRPNARLHVEALERRLTPATFPVTNANDAGAGSLRAAIAAANAAAGLDTVAFDVAFFATPRTVTLTGTGGQLAITDDLTIAGPGPGLLTVSGGGAVRVFDINNPNQAITASISGLTVTGGTGNSGGPTPTTGPGGGIRCDFETLFLTNVVVTGNATSGGNGGGGIVVNAGRLELLACTVSGNTSAGGGGIGVFSSGSLSLQSSTVSGNVAGSNGGGVLFAGTVPAVGFTVRNSTITGNTTAGSGGGLYLLAFGGSATPILIQNSTITGNTASTTATGSGLGGGGIALAASGGAVATINVQSSIVSGNASSAANGRSDIATAATMTCNVNFSAVGDPDGFTPSGSSSNNLPFGTALDLFPLANYGGPTATIALRIGSPAVDSGFNPAALMFDQRGPGFPRIVGSAPDIGAAEGPLDLPAASGGPFAPVTASGGTVYTFDITYTSTSPIDVATLDGNDIRVTGPNGIPQPAVFISVTPAGNGSPRTATYRFTAPGGTFGPEDNGTYAIAVQGGQVANTAGGTAPAATVGTFQVAVPPTLTVTNLNDTGTGSLRQAILTANGTPALTEAIVFQPGLTGTLNIGSPLTITDDVTIAGPGPIAVSGGEFTRVFTVSDGTAAAISVAISGLTIVDGRTTTGVRGAGIFFDNEALTLDRVVVRDNATNGANTGGSGIAGIAGGSLVVRDSTISNNGFGFETNGQGGGIAVYAGTLVVERCTISGNRSGTTGGGIYFSSIAGTGGATIRNSTITGNTAPSGGGIAVGYAAAGGPPLVVQNCTLTGNVSTTAITAPGFGGGGLVVTSPNAPTVSVVSSVVSGNTATNGQADISVPSPAVVNVNFSAIGVATGFTLSGTSGNNLPFGTALGLLPLANNGGPTQTFAFAANSPLRDAGSNPAAVSTDQRGPGFARTGGPGTDIGAFEFQVAAAAPRVTAVNVNAGQSNTTQRSRVTSIDVVFSTQVTFAGNVAAAFTVSRIGGVFVVGFTATANVVGGVTVVTLFNFTGTETRSGSLADGRFQLTVLANQVTAGGQQLDGDGNGTGGDNFVLNGSVANGLFSLYGDGNGDGIVNAADFGPFRNAFGTAVGNPLYRDFLDFDGDGFINAADFTQFRLRFGATVP